MKRFIIAIMAFALLATSCLNNSHPSSSSADKRCPEFAVNDCQPTPGQAKLIKEKVISAIHRVAKSDGFKVASIRDWYLEDLRWLPSVNSFETVARCTASAESGVSHEFCYSVRLNRSQKKVVLCLRRRDLEDFRKAQADSIRKAEAQAMYDAVFGALDSLENENEGTQIVNLLSR